MDAFRTIAEKKIREAIEEGQFKDLPGSGRPLRLEDETWIPEDLRMAYRVLKNAGCVPPEIELRKEVLNLKSLISNIDDDKERIRKLRELNYKIMLLNMHRKAPLHLENFPAYEEKVIEKMLSS